MSEPIKVDLSKLAIGIEIPASGEITQATDKLYQTQTTPHNSRDRERDKSIISAWAKAVLPDYAQEPADQPTPAYISLMHIQMGAAWLGEIGRNDPIAPARILTLDGTVLEEWPRAHYNQTYKLWHYGVTINDVEYVFAKCDVTMTGDGVVTMLEFYVEPEQDSAL